MRLILLALLVVIVGGCDHEDLREEKERDAEVRRMGGNPLDWAIDVYRPIEDIRVLLKQQERTKDPIVSVFQTAVNSERGYLQVIPPYPSLLVWLDSDQDQELPVVLRLRNQ